MVLAGGDFRNLQDGFTVEKAENLNPECSLTGGEVVNWFDRDTFDPTTFSIKDTLASLMKHPPDSTGRMMDRAKGNKG